jgi:hypothetical protein
MDTDWRLDDPPVVFVESRLRALPLVGIGVAAIAVTVWGFTHGWVWMVAGAGAFAVIAIQTLASAFITFLRPGCLILAPESLTHHGRGPRRRWTWSDVGSFALVERGVARWIVFSLRGVSQMTGRQVTLVLPAHWSDPAEEVCATLNAARERWGGKIA